MQVKITLLNEDELLYTSQSSDFKIAIMKLLAEKAIIVDGVAYPTSMILKIEEYK